METKRTLPRLARLVKSLFFDSSVLGVYKVPNINERVPITFTNIMLCVNYGTHYLAEFISLPAERYVVAYHSYNDGCIKGMSNVFTVTNFN